VSKPLKLGRPTVALRPSRIRREPVQLETTRPLTKAEIEKAEARSREIEIWGGVAGVVLFAAGIVALTFGISAATIFKNDPAAAAAAARFNQCYNAEGPDCVLDGDTIRLDGKKVEIAGIAAPAIVDAQCPEERSRGIDAAVRLADLLNGGNVTVGAPIRDAYGREVRKVQVGGEDVGDTLIDAGLARKYDGTPQEWC
jgi:endonuclease YncB( thermonuclease family)